MDYNQGTLKPMCSPFFPLLRQQLGPYLVDKTKLIENIVRHSLKGNVDLVLRPRRCGKTTMLQMLRSFFSIPEDGNPDPSSLFQGLDIASERDICEQHMGKYAVIFCDFKNIYGDSWDEMVFSFKHLISTLYDEWYQYLDDSLNPRDKAFFESIRLKTASLPEWKISLERLSFFLARESGRRVIVLIDEYEAPNSCAYENGFFDQANKFFGRSVLPPLLKTNKNLEYAVLAGVTPVAKAGWYSGLNNLDIHSLHKAKSVFAGMVMFTESEVLHLKKLSNSTLELEALKAHYNSYLADGHISVYNPVSIMSAFQANAIKNFWVATGEYPLLSRNFQDGGLTPDIIERLLVGEEISVELKDNVTFSNSNFDADDTSTLLYYAGYLTMTPTGRFKIPNQEVTTDWATWITRDIKQSGAQILDTCVEGPVRAFEEEWPIFIQQDLHPKMVAKARGAVSRKTPEVTYHVYFLGLTHILRAKGWEVFTERRAGVGYVDICLIKKTTRSAVLIELKSSEKKEDIERDTTKALEQIVDNNYRNREGLRDIKFLREYGIASFHLTSCAKGQYLQLLNGQWVEKDDPNGS